jgi:NADPH:quinone reductase-like Zn-dependent oxidoreductase
MKAIAIDGYGDAHKLQLREIPDPRPKAGEVLVRVRAAAVNPLDWKIRDGQLRRFLGIAFPYVPGCDIAGEVVASGATETSFEPGRAVVAFLDPRRGGGYAEYAVAKVTTMARKPEKLSFAEAASLPIAGCTALQALRDAGRLSKGGSALVIGGAGGVGHFAIQIAKALGAKVSATCGPSNIEFVRSLGADFVVDYRSEDFTTRPERYDVIFDTQGKSAFSACKHNLNPDGVYVTTLPSANLVFWSAVQSALALFSKTQRATLIMVRPSAKDLEFLGRLADDGALRPVVTETFPLADARAAHQLSQTGHARGKIVLAPAAEGDAAT